MSWIWLVCQKSELLCQQAPKIAWCTLTLWGMGLLTILYILWHHSRVKLYGKYMQQSAVSKFSWHVTYEVYSYKEYSLEELMKFSSLTHEIMYDKSLRKFTSHPSTQDELELVSWNSGSGPLYRPTRENLHCLCLVHTDTHTVDFRSLQTPWKLVWERGTNILLLMAT